MNTLKAQKCKLFSRVYLLLVSAVFLFGVSVSPVAAQTSKGVIKVEQKTYALEVDSVYVNMDIFYDQAILKSKTSVLLIPELKSDNRTMELPIVIVCGNNAYKSYKRMSSFGYTPYGADIVLNASGKTSGIYSYKAAVKYEPWMDNAEFTLREEQCECNGESVPFAFDILAKNMENRNHKNVPALYEPRLAYNYIIPEVEEIKRRSENVTAYLNFYSGRWDIAPNYKENSRELVKIYKLIESLENYPDATVTGIIIEGYASPEGTAVSNQRLSENRAEAVKNHLKSYYRFNDSFITSRGLGEDWITLDSLVSNSTIAQKSELLSIIRSSEPFDTRDKQLLSLSGGAPYRQMLSDIYPLLRRVECKVNYTVLPFSVEEGKKIIGTRPSSLSLNEMFLISQTYVAGSKEFNELFETAAKVFPNSDVANLNAAVNAFTRNDAQAASEYMSRITNQTAVYYNNMGVLSYLKGNFAESADYFAKAKAAGSSEAIGNSTEMEKVISNRQAIYDTDKYNEAMKARLNR